MRKYLPLMTYVVLLFATFLFIAPVVIMFIASLKPDARVLAEAGSWAAFWPAAMSLQNYYDVFERVAFDRFMLNSLIINGMIVSLGLLVNAMAGYALARLNWVGRKVLLALCLLLMIVPMETIAIPLFYQVSWLGWRDTYLVQILPFVANAFSIYLFYTYYINFPKALEESASMDGAGPFAIFFFIVLPNSKPVLASVAILTFLMHWGAYLWPLLVTTRETVRPLPLAIAVFYTLPPLQWGDIFAFGVMMVLPLVGIFLFFQSWFVRGVTTSGIKG